MATSRARTEYRVWLSTMQLQPMRDGWVARARSMPPPCRGMISGTPSSQIQSINDLEKAVRANLPAS